MMALLPIISALGTVFSMFASHKPEIQQAGTAIASSVGVASMVAATKMPRWFYNLKFVGRVFDQVINLIAFNLGYAQNAKSFDDKVVDGYDN
jgi:hypothetical protein